MNDTEFTGLELRLRQLRPAQAPAAPQALRQFIATVPATMAPRRPLALRLAGSSPLRRGVSVAGLAAALVLALVVSSFVVNFRASQTAAPAAAGEWQWQRADGSVLGSVLRVAHGYVADCQPASVAAATPSDALEQLKSQLSGSDAASLCTSPDGLTWTTPADPRIVDVPAGSTFSPGPEDARLGSLHVLASTTSDNAGNTVSDVWRSTDDVSWKRVGDPQLDHLMMLGLGVVDGRFVAVAMDVSTSIGWVVVSTDGLSWERTNQLPGTPNTGTVAGGLMTFSSDNGVTRLSRDGSTWQEVKLPAGIGLTSGITALPSGGYFATGMGSGQFDQHILRSADAITWQQDDGALPGHVLAYAWLGDRLIASVVQGSDATDPSSYSDLHLWESRDEGHTWSKLLGPDGKQIAGRGSRMGDALAVVTPDAQYRPHLTWVGRLAPAADTADPFCQSAPGWLPQAAAGSNATASDWWVVADYWSDAGHSCSESIGQVGKEPLLLLARCESSGTIEVDVIDQLDGSIVGAIPEFDCRPEGSATWSVGWHSTPGQYLGIHVKAPPGSGRIGLVLAGSDAAITNIPGGQQLAVPPGLIAVTFAPWPTASPSR